MPRQSFFHDWRKKGTWSAAGRPVGSGAYHVWHVQQTVVEGGGRRWKAVEGGGRWWKVAEGGARWGKVGQGGGRWSFKLSGGKLSGGKLSGGTLSGGTPFQARRAGCCCTA